MKKRRVVKLQIRRETLRELDRTDLAQVVGGYTGDVQCPLTVPAAPAVKP